MAERLRYAINNCRSIDMDNYMLSRNVDNAEGSDTDYWPPACTWKCMLCRTQFSIRCRLLWLPMVSHLNLKHIIKCFYFTFGFLAVKLNLGGPHNLFTHMYTHSHNVLMYIPSLYFEAQSFSTIHSFLALPFFRIFCMSVLFTKWQKRKKCTLCIMLH